MLKVVSVLTTTVLFSSLSYGMGAPKVVITQPVVKPVIAIGSPITITPCPQTDPR